MFTYRVDLLNALGINYESWADFLVIRGKRYKRGLSFPKQDFPKATEYCLNSNLQGISCILVDDSVELTAWLHTQNADSVDSTEENPISESQMVDYNQQAYQPAPQNSPTSKTEMIYRGIKYNP